MAARWAAVATIVLLAGCAQFSFPSLSMGQKADTQEEAPSADESDATGETVAQAQPAPIPEPQEVPKPGKLYEWNGDGRSVSRIVIDTNEQKARFYDGDEQIGWTTIASGVAKHPTPRGEFTILEKVKDKRSNLYGKIVNSKGGVIKASAHGKDRVPSGGRFVGASMPHFMRMTYDGIGMHAGPIPRPGSPASHGCIRMPKQFAATVFNHVSHGTAVTVIGNGPDYGNYGERIARQQAEERARRAAEAAAAATEGPTLDALDAEVSVMQDAQPYADANMGTSTGPGRGTSASRASSTKSGTSTSRTTPARASNPAASGSASETPPSSADSNAAGSIESTPTGARPPYSAPAPETAPDTATGGSDRSTDITAQSASTSAPASEQTPNSAPMPAPSLAPNPAPAIEQPAVDAQAPAPAPPPSATRQPEPATSTPAPSANPVQHDNAPAMAPAKSRAPEYSAPTPPVHSAATTRPRLSPTSPRDRVLVSTA